MAAFELFHLIGRVSMQGGDAVVKQLKGVEGVVARVGQGMGTLGKNMTKYITLPLMAAGAFIGKIGVDFDEAYDTIRADTGATGKILEGLKEDFKDVVSGVPDDFGAASTAISLLNKRLGLTNKPLSDMAKQMLNLSRLTKSDVKTNIDVLTKTFNNWKISTDKQAKSLDFLYKVYQNTGIGVERLSSLMNDSGAVLRALGYDFETSAALLGSFEKAGVNAGSVLSSLKIAIMKMSREGIKDPVEALEILMQRIKDAGSAGEANAIGIETFGRGTTAMVDAIRDGSFDLDDFLQKLKDSPETINAAADATLGFTDKLKLFKNKAMVALEPLGITFIDTLDDLMPAFEGIIDKVKTAVEWFGNLSPEARRTLIVFGGLLAVAGPLITGIAGIAKSILSVRTAVIALGASEKASWLLGAGKFLIPIIAGIVQVGDSVQYTGDSMEKLFSLTVKAGQAVDNYNKKFAEFPKEVYEEHEALLNTISDLVEAYPLLADKVVELQDKYDKGEITFLEYNQGLKDIIESKDELIGATDDLSQAEEDLAKTYEDMGYSREDAINLAKSEVAILGEVGDAAGEANEETEDLVESTEDLVAALFKLYNINQSVIEATWDYEDAIAEYNKVMKDSTKTDREKKKSLFEVQDSLESLIESMLKEIEATDTTIERKQALIDQMFRVADAAIAMGITTQEEFINMALQFGFSAEQIITKAEEMGWVLDDATKAHIVEVSMSGAGDVISQAGQVKAAVDKIPHEKSIHVTMVTSGISAGPTGSAPAGYTPPKPGTVKGGQEGLDVIKSGTVMVGEAGPEYLNLPTGAKVVPLDKAGIIITNIFEIAEMNIREEADIYKTADKLADIQERSSRGRGKRF